MKLVLTDIALEESSLTGKGLSLGCILCVVELALSCATPLTATMRFGRWSADRTALEVHPPGGEVRRPSARNRSGGPVRHGDTAALQHQAAVDEALACRNAGSHKFIIVRSHQKTSSLLRARMNGRPRL